jgi:hypothetical protein
VRSLNEVFHQRGLADPGLAVEHQHSAATAPRGREQPLESLTLPPAPKQLPPRQRGACRSSPHVS